MDDSYLSEIRADFPLIAQEEYVYLDNAATTQKPQAVLDAVASYYQHSNANVHRAAHGLASVATQQFEDARRALQSFINAPSSDEIIWTSGTTAAINLVAHSWGETHISADDEILLTRLEHHSNIVPWQMLASRKSAKIVVCETNAEGELDLEQFAQLLNERTRLVAVGHVSNALGTVNPVRKLADLAHACGAIVLVDGAQATGHMPVDVQALGADFYALSGHKMFAPTGTGALYGRRELLEAMPPWQGGGEMIERVSFDGTTFNQLPYKFEAGTPNIGGAVGMGAAIQYMNGLDRAKAERQEQALLQSATSAIAQLPGVRVVGTAATKSGVLSFQVTGAHPADIGTLLDQQQIAVRVGHHCAMPLMDKLGLPGTVRASFSMYNNQADVDRFVKALDKALSFL